METRNSKTKKRQADDVVEEEKSVKPKKCTEKMRRYRANVKSDPARLEKMRKKDRERKRAKREEQKLAILGGNRKLAKKLKEQRNAHMQEYRKKKKKTKKKDQEISQLKKTDTSQEGKKEKQKEATKKWRMKIKMISTTDNPPTSCSKSTLYRETRRVGEVLPKTPEKKVAVIEKLLQSPNTSGILEKKGIIMGKEVRKKLEMADSLIETVKQDISSVKPKGTQRIAQKVKYNTLVQTAVKAIRKKYNMGYMLGLGRKHKVGKQWTTLEEIQRRKKRKDRISDEVRKRVTEFYLSPDISREVPDKNQVLKVKEGTNTELIQKHVMSVTVIEAYSRFKERYPQDKIGLTTFRKSKPLQVKQISETNRRSCLCQKCCNLALKAEALRKFAIQLEVKDVRTDKTKIAESTLCEKEDREFHKKSCLERTCNTCGLDSIDEHYSLLTEKSKEKKKMIQYHKWEYISIQKEDDVIKRIISCVSKSSSFEDFLKELKDDLQDYCLHKFRASWQHQQLAKYIQQIPEHSVLMVMDFAENYKCSFQNEVQSAFFDQNLVTIHPCMLYYKKILDGKSFLMKHSIIGISNDLKHDAHLVKEFEKKIITIVKEHIPDLDKIVQFTDGCAAQYKGKNSFGYLSTSEIEKERNFFETSHGKNVCDGLGAIVKMSCYRAVLSGKVIANPQDVYDHCKEALTRQLNVNVNESIMSLREFIFIDRRQVNRTETPDFTTLVGTRKVHSVRSTGTEFIVESRNLTCFCKGCMQSGDCDMDEYVNSWSRANLNPNENASAMESRCQKKDGQKKKKSSRF